MCGGFESNAQTLRILTRLEPKVLGEHGEPYGLNLTRATASTPTMKYPWPRRDVSSRKFGVYADDLDAVHLGPAGGPGNGGRSLEAQIMDWADDVAYSVHDVEDGVVGRTDLVARASSTPRNAPHSWRSRPEHFCSQPVAVIEHRGGHVAGSCPRWPTSCGSPTPPRRRRWRSNA